MPEPFSDHIGPYVSGEKLRRVTVPKDQYTINAQGAPTLAELDYINRQQAWQLTRSGRR